jgi:hypothetical protein
VQDAHIPYGFCGEEFPPKNGREGVAVFTHLTEKHHQQQKKKESKVYEKCNWRIVCASTVCLDGGRQHLSTD